MAFNRAIASLVLLSIVTLVVAAKADDASTSRERLERVTAASSLSDLNSQPWHLKLDVTLFNAAGKNPVDGTIEYRQSGADSLRIITIGSNSETVLIHDGKHFRSISGSDVPELAADMFQEFIHPGPSPADMEGTKPELRKQTFGKTPLDCIMLTRPFDRFTSVPLGLFPTYCIEPTADRLRASYDFGGRTVTINGIGRFLDHEVATAFVMSEGTVIVATGKVASLAVFSPTPEMFKPSPDQKATTAAIARISSGVIQGNRLTSVAPVYPETDRASHHSGTVTLRAIIGRDGHVHRLMVMSAPTPGLAISALAAARQWTYKPYLLNGEVTDVDTTIIVNFNLGP